MRKGKVLLVGAGPGDASLITVKGLIAIREAQVIVHDRLVNLDLIAQASPNCQIINVGKNRIITQFLKRTSTKSSLIMP